MNPNAEGTCWSCSARLVARTTRARDAVRRAARRRMPAATAGSMRPGVPTNASSPSRNAWSTRNGPNFCDLFEPAAKAGTPVRPSAEDLRSAAEALFRGGQQ